VRVIREVEFGEGKALVKELTLAELRAWLVEAARRVTVDLVDELFTDQDILISDIPYFCDLGIEALAGRAPSEIAPLVAVIREVNAHFFVIWRRRLEAVTGLPVVEPISLPGQFPG
jgi:hypothetical protein